MKGIYKDAVLTFMKMTTLGANISNISLIVIKNIIRGVPYSN